MTDRRRNTLVLGVVAGLFLVSLLVIIGIPGAVKAKKTRLGLDLKGGVELVYQGLPSAQTPKVTPDALARAVDIMRNRVDQLGVAEPQIQTSGDNQITVGLPNVTDTGRAEREVGTTAQLAFYDWEANVLTPNGKTVASQLQTQDPTATQISQGSQGTAPGSPGAGSMNLYDAVKLASQQPESSSTTNSRITPEYYMFGAPGSAACEAAAKANGTVPAAGQHCLLSGPDNNKTDLLSGLPAGVTESEGEILTVPRGTVVLQAVPASFAKPTPIGDPSAQFFVLRDDVALRGSDITDPHGTTDPNIGQPIVTFGFSSKGKSQFQDVTGNIARRGDLVSRVGETLNQHFAVALDGRLVTVPFIDFRQYPNGISAGNGANIAGGLTVQSAKDLATILRYGPLPVTLTPTG